MPVTYLTPEEIKKETEKRDDFQGRRFGRLMVLRAVAVWHGTLRKHSALVWECLCDCGNLAHIRAWQLTSQKTKSCGCLRNACVIHGQWDTRGYRARHNMMHRCYMPSHPRFDRWGGRGIRVCARWRGSAAAFLADMGQPPSTRHSIDRIDNDGHYSCGKCDECRTNGWTANCRWATRAEQNDNRHNTRMLTINGETKSIRAWAEQSGVNKTTIEGRLRYGNWTVEDAVFTPPDSRMRVRREADPS